MELLREETENVVAFLNNAFENSLKEAFSGKVQVARARVIKNGKHLAKALFRSVETPNGRSLRDK